MRRFSLLTSLLFAVTIVAAAQAPPAQPTWRETVDQKLPLLGHRNWVLIVDSAFPLYSSPGVEVIETDADGLEVTRYVLGALNHSIHVRPDVFLDSELPFLAEADAPGVTSYREKLTKALAGRSPQSLPHEKLLAQVDEASKMYRILVLKTRLAVPYTSVFLRLNCKYWSDDAEQRLRAKMAGGTQ